ncbi:MAG: GTPase ObgE [Planctomycetes bacterium]|nr:GTPase ObgE [Planctomycetota bacterium]
MFRDEAKVFVKAGDGGSGCMSFRHEKYLPKGGPDGGDGGRGGHVIFVADESENTLLTLVRNPHIRAKKGGYGMGNNRTGKNGEDHLVKVPVGTIIKDFETGVALKDLADPEQEVIVVKGGRGGYGNARFKSSTNQTPRRVDMGSAGEERTLKLELKLIADVGLLGLPNAGKSTLVSRVSAATPKIADYPFTTLDPHPGIVELSGWRRFVMMDIPGLIEGAHLGQGLGDKFLRHVERTRVLVHLIDLAPDGPTTTEEQYEVILGEIRSFGGGLADKPRIVVYSKADLIQDPEERAEELNAALGVTGYPISAITGLNLDRLLEDCWRCLKPEGD